MKIRVTEFNNLSFEERQLIHYYMVQSKIEEINFIFNRYKNDLSPVLKSLLKKRQKALKNTLNDEYEVVREENGYRNTTSGNG